MLTVCAVSLCLKKQAEGVMHPRAVCKRANLLRPAAYQLTSNRHCKNQDADGSQSSSTWPVPGTKEGTVDKAGHKHISCSTTFRRGRAFNNEVHMAAGDYTTLERNQDVLAGEMLQYGCVGKPLQVTGRHIGIALVSCPHHSLQAFQHGEGFYMVHSLPQNPGLPCTSSAAIDQGVRCLGQKSQFCKVINAANKRSVATAVLVVLHS